LSFRTVPVCCLRANLFSLCLCGIQVCCDRSFSKYSLDARYCLSGSPEFVRVRQLHGRLAEPEVHHGAFLIPELFYEFGFIQFSYFTNLHRLSVSTRLRSPRILGGLLSGILKIRHSEPRFWSGSTVCERLFEEPLVRLLRERLPFRRAFVHALPLLPSDRLHPYHHPCGFQRVVN